MDKKNINPFSKTFQKSVQTQSKKSKSLAEMQNPNKFQLMSKKEYQIIKQDIYNQIIDSNKDFVVTDYLTNTLKMSLTPISQDHNHISLLSNSYFDNAKLKKLSELAPYDKCIPTYVARTNQYLNRLAIIQKVHDLLPQIVSQIAVDLIQKYVSLGFNTAYSVVPLQTSLDQITIKLSLNQKEIPNDSYVFIRARPHLKEILNTMRLTKISLDGNYFKKFTELLQHFLNLGNNIDLHHIEENESIIAFLKALYDIDFSLFFKDNRNKDPHFCRQLMLYGLRLYDKMNPSLANYMKTNDNISCKEAYNKMLATKYYLRELVSDVYIYQHFAYFMIPRTLKNTGRIYSSPYVLQAQGNKMIRAFMQFWFKEQPNLLPEHLQSLKKIMKQTLPDLSHNFLYFDPKKYKTSDF